VAKKQQRNFGMGEKVRISKKSRVVDRARSMESDKSPIDQDVTGAEGEVTAAPYESPLKDGECCVPIKLASGAVVGVPESRLEPASVSRSRAGYSRRYAEEHEKVFGNGKKPHQRKGH
jgi:hypothetical protein